MEEKERQEALIGGSKDESKILRWLQSACASTNEKDSRPVLTGIRIFDGIVLGCDGFRIHAVPRPDALEGDYEGSLVGKIPAGEFIAKMEVIEGGYPNYEEIIPDDEPVFEIAVNAKFLRDALAGMESPVLLRFWKNTNPMEIMGTGRDDQSRYALIMPMHVSTGRDRFWRPEKYGQEADEVIEELNEES
jgi:hypothetical protein